MKRSLLLFAAVTALFVFAAFGCEEAEEAVEPEEVDEEGEAVEEEPEEEAPEEAEEGMVVTDQMGREVKIETTPERIVSLSPSNTEISFALGLEDQVVGVTDFCDYPPEIEEKEAVGGFDSPSIEKIIELEPELVLASTIHEEEVGRLEDMDIAVLVVESSELAGLYESITLIAEMTGVAETGEELVASMQERIDAVKEKIGEIDDEERILVFYEVYADPLMTAGKDAFINEIITLAGGKNIFGDVEEDYPEISAEKVAELQPEVILYPDVHGSADFVLEEMAARPGWESVPAVENQRLYDVDDNTFSRPGPRVVGAVEEAAEIFYPDKF
ncbi:MAG: cobalamin-binding protein [Bacillota bacterium]